jgi:hypothetical protein
MHKSHSLKHAVPRALLRSYRFEAMAYLSRHTNDDLLVVDMLRGETLVLSDLTAEFAVHLKSGIRAIDILRVLNPQKCRHRTFLKGAAKFIEELQQRKFLLEVDDD